MVEDKVIMALCKFGGYVFKPVTPKVLIENNVFKTNGLFPGLSVGDNGPLYIIGFAVNKVFRKKQLESQYPPRLQPIDDFTVGYPYNSITPTSVVFVYGDCLYSEIAHRRHPYVNYHVQIWKEDTTRLLEALIKVAGVQFSFEKGVDSVVVRSCLEQYSEAQRIPKTEQATERPVESTMGADIGNIRLSRKEILDLLQTARECVIRAETCDRNCAKCPLVQDSKKLVAMYDTMIKAYSGVIKQNNKGKCVRMADGSRKWIPNEMAMELLKLPREQRVRVEVFKENATTVSKDVDDALALTVYPNGVRNENNAKEDS